MPSPTKPATELKMSSNARTRLRNTEKAVYKFYDDLGPGRGNCTWGIGILAHRGPCSAGELKTVVSDALVEAEFTKRVAEAERAVRKNVSHQALNQEQFDALVSFTYNVGAGGAGKALEMVDEGRFGDAAQRISSMNKVCIKTRRGSKLVIARGLLKRRAEESSPFRIN